MLKIIIFDFDGVIENNYELHYNLSQKQITDITREEHRKLFEGNIHVERKKLAHRDTGFDLKKHFNDAKKTIVTDPKVKEILTYLFKKYTLGILTSAKEDGTNYYLKNNNIDDLFSFVYGYESGELKSEKIRKILSNFNVTKEECIFVTDTLGDILEANSMGIKTIAIDSGYHERERLQKGNPFKIISHLTDLVSNEKELLSV